MDGQEAASGRPDGESFMQSAFWARFKASTGWKAHSIDTNLPGGGSVTALVRPLGMGFSFCYVPHGPRLPAGLEDPQAFLESLAARIASRVGGRLLFVRFDLAWSADGEAGASLLDSLSSRRGKLRRGAAVQVPDTTLLDIEKSEDKILAGMKPKWRYNIRLAEKKGVEVKREGVEAIETFYALYLETARRDGIAIHPLSYYRELFAAAEREAASGTIPRPVLSVWVARHEGKPIAAIITLFHGQQAIYLYGASSGEQRNLMPAYALQWHAIEAAKAEGCSEYDFFGIPPDSDPSHPMAGLYLFKTGFGGDILHRVGSVDFPCMPLAYAIFRKAESIRLFWFKRVKKVLKGAKAKS